MLEDVFSYVLAGIIFLYCFQFVKYGMVLTFSRKDQDEHLTKEFLQLTVIIPVRDEIDTLQSLLSDLKKQNYPSSHFEVLFIDDHSSDGTSAYLQKNALENSKFRYLSLGENGSGKKDAIALGVENASGDWIVQTDADCTLPKDFFLSHASKAAGEEMSLIAGPVMLQHKRGLWNSFESLEFMSLAGAGMASFLNGKPMMCNGANLSYSKDFYLEVKESLSRNQSPSGDDIFLLQEAKRLHKGIGFLYSSRSVVLTQPSGSLLSFINQRMRWGSKSPYYKDPGMIYLSILVWLANVSLLSGLIASILQPGMFLLFFILLGLKSVADFWVLLQSAKFFNRMYLLPFFLPAAIIYYFYITSTGLASIIGSFSWKGRTYS